MKTCNRCHTTKGVSEFPKNNTKRDGLHGSCLDCEAERSVRYRKLNIEKVRARERERDRKRRLDPDKRAKSDARIRARYRVRKGEIKKPSACPSCGSSNRRIEAHHKDYSKPLDVKWLCSRCHGLEHRGIQASNRSDAPERR